MNKVIKKPLFLIFIALCCFVLFLILTYTIINISLFKQAELSPNIGEVATEEPTGSAILDLYDQLPYVGSNFSFTFSYEDGYFYYYISPSNQTEGNREFDEFLRQNDIEQRSQVIGLRESDVPLPTPEP